MRRAAGARRGTSPPSARRRAPSMATRASSSRRACSTLLRGARGGDSGRGGAAEPRHRARQQPGVDPQEGVGPPPPRARRRHLPSPRECSAARHAAPGDRGTSAPSTAASAAAAPAAARSPSSRTPRRDRGEAAGDDGERDGPRHDLDLFHAACHGPSSRRARCLTSLRGSEGPRGGRRVRVACTAAAQRTARGVAEQRAGERRGPEQLGNGSVPVHPGHRGLERGHRSGRGRAGRATPPRRRPLRARTGDERQEQASASYGARRRGERRQPTQGDRCRRPLGGPATSASSSASRDEQAGAGDRERNGGADGERTTAARCRSARRRVAGAAPAGVGATRRSTIATVDGVEPRHGARHQRLDAGRERLEPRPSARERLHQAPTRARAARARCGAGRAARARGARAPRPLRRASPRSAPAPRQRVEVERALLRGGGDDAALAEHLAETGGAPTRQLALVQPSLRPRRVARCDLDPPAALGGLVAPLVGRRPRPRRARPAPGSPGARRARAGSRRAAAGGGGGSRAVQAGRGHGDTSLHLGVHGLLHGLCALLDQLRGRAPSSGRTDTRPPGAASSSWAVKVRP